MVPLESRAALRRSVRVIPAERSSTFSSPHPPPRVALWVFLQSLSAVDRGSFFFFRASVGFRGRGPREPGPNRAAVSRQKRQSRSEHLARYQPRRSSGEVRKVRDVLPHTPGSRIDPVTFCKYFSGQSAAKCSLYTAPHLSGCTMKLSLLHITLLQDN